MIFGGFSETLWTGVKNVAVRNSVMGDFERKTLMFRGVERAHIEVPVTRQIEIDFICAEATIPANPQKCRTTLRLFAAAMLQQGIAKLYLDDDAALYYWARVKSATPPTINGVSAKMTLTFECADYQGQNTSQSAFTPLNVNNFTFNGKHCRTDFGCEFVEESRQTVPYVRANKYSLTGRNGTYRYAQDAPVLDEWELAGTLYFVDRTTEGGLLSPTQIRNRARQVASWLINAQRGVLWFDSDLISVITPTISNYYAFEAEVIEAQEFTTDEWENGAVRLRMLVQPVARENVGVAYVNAGAGSAQTAFSMNVDILPTWDTQVGYRTPARIEIENTGSTTITQLMLYFSHAGLGSYYMIFKDAEDPFTIPPYTKLVIDTENRTIELTDGYEMFEDYSKFAYSNADALLPFGWPYAYPVGASRDNVLHIYQAYGVTGIKVSVRMNRRYVG